MLYNEVALANAVTEKISLLTFHAIVNEAYINALPYDDGSLSAKKKDSLSKFTLETLEAMGGIKVLESAIASEKDSKKLSFLNGMHSACMEACVKASKRIKQSASLENKNITKGDTKAKSKQVVDTVKLTNSEIDEFKNSVDKLSLDNISDVIRDKVIETIKKEQEEYEKEDALKEELKEKLASTKSFSDKSTESYLELIAGTDVKTQHTSLFSTIQCGVYESLMYRKDNSSKINKDIITDITMEALSISPRNSKLEKVLESCMSYSNSCNADVDPKKIQEICLINTIAIYTFLQTLSTLNLVKFNVNSIKNYVESSPDLTTKLSDKIEFLKSSVLNELLSINRFINTCNNNDELSGCKISLERMKNDINKISLDNCDHLKSDLIEKIDNCINNQINPKIEKISGFSIKSDDSILSLRAVQMDISEFNKIYTLFKNIKEIDTLKFIVAVPSSNRISYLNLLAINNNGNILDKSFIQIKYDFQESNFSIERYIRLCIQNSNLKDVNKKMILTFEGLSTKIELN